jgi:outer membrane protein
METSVTKEFSLQRRVAIAVFAGLASQVAAQSTASAQDRQPRGWQLDVGAAVIGGPRFPGANDMRVLAIPSIEASDNDRIFVSVREGIGYKLVRGNGFEFGPLLSFSFGRRESDQSSALRGLGNVDFTVEGGAFLRYNFGRYLATGLKIRQGVNGHNGLVVEGDIRVRTAPLLSNRLFLSAGPQVSYYDESYAKAYFGITPSQSRASGYKAFAPGDGLSAGIGGTAIYRLTDKWTLVGFASHQRLLGDIADSPLVLGRYGSRSQTSVGSSVSYRFYL